MCFVFSTNFVWNISRSKENWTRYYKKRVFVFIQSTSYSCQVLMNLEFFRLISEKHSNIKVHENPTSGGRHVPCERSDRQTDRTKLIVAFRNFVIAPKKWYQSVHLFMSINHQFSNERIAVSRNNHSYREKLSPKTDNLKKEETFGKTMLLNNQ